MAFWYRVAPPTWDLPPARPQAPGLAALEFSAWAESRHITGVTLSNDRLSDVFNRRDPFRVHSGVITQFDAQMRALPGQSEFLLDPFECDFVLGPRLTGRDRGIATARRIHKVAYPVVIEGRDFDVRGTVHLMPGNAPELATYHVGSLFLPVTNATVRRGRHVVSGPTTDVVLVNRYVVRKVRPLDTLD